MAQARFRKFALQVVLGFLQTLLVFALALGKGFARFFIFFWIRIWKCRVLQFLLGDAHTQPVGYRGVNLKRFQCNAFPLIITGDVFQCSCVVEAVHQLDDEDADVLRRRGKKFPQRFRVAFHSAIAKSSQFRNALHERQDFLATEFLYRLRRNSRILYRVVQKSGCGGLRTHSGGCKQISDLGCVHEVRVAGISLLVLVRLLCKLVRFCYKRDIIRVFAGQCAEDI